MKTQDIITKKPYLAWYIKDSRSLSDESVLEHVLNYGNWDDVQTFIQIKGWKDTAKIFRMNAQKTRSNYFPEVKAYFARYFDKYAS